MKPALVQLEARVAAIGPPAWCGLCPDGKVPKALDPKRPAAARCAPPVRLKLSADAAFVELAAAYWDEQAKRFECAAWGEGGRKTAGEK